MNHKLNSRLLGEIAITSDMQMTSSDDTTLMGESQELKSLLMKVKEEREKSWLKTQHSEWLLSKSLQAINAGEGVEKREPSYTVGGNADWYSHYGKQCGDFLKNWK